MKLMDYVTMAFKNDNYEFFFFLEDDNYGFGILDSP